MRVLCVSGGPGFAPAYLVRAVREALECDAVPFASSGNFRQQVEDLSRQFTALKEQGRIGVVAHSWGSLLTISMLSEHRWGDVRFVCLVNPIPLEKKYFKQVAARFRRNMSLRQKSAVLFHAVMGDSAAVAEALLPIYGVIPEKHIVAELDLSLDRYRRGLTRVRWPSISGCTQHLERCTVIRGEHDITPTSLLSPLHGSRRWVTIPNAGHFPMYDAMPAFRDALRGLDY